MLLLIFSGLLLAFGSDASDFVSVIESSSLNGRIVGGTTAHKGQFPYQVSLKTALAKSHFCGGFIITERWLGSAAHCTSNRTPDNVIAVVGAVARSLDGTIVQLLKFENHPEYDNLNLRNDISLIKTVKPIKFNDAVQPIRLNLAYASDEMNAIVTGWGYTSNPGQAASNLQWINVKTLDLDECRSKLTKSNARRIFETSLCAESLTKGGACMGDSGGPLVGKDNALIGIVSWGVPCSMGYPDVYTRINSYQSWINDVIDFD